MTAVAWDPETSADQLKAAHDEILKLVSQEQGPVPVQAVLRHFQSLSADVIARAMLGLLSSGTLAMTDDRRLRRA